MTSLRDAWHRLRGLAGRRRMEERLEDEFRFHLEMATARNERLGLPADEARRTALAAFGGRERFKDEVRDEVRSRVLEELGRDVRYGARVLRRNPSYAITAALTFALGVGASTAIFSVVHGVLLRPLPYREPDRLVALWERDVARGRQQNVVSARNFLAWRERSRSYEGMAALVPAPVTVDGATQAERVVGAEVSPGYFRLLGVAPALGRDFTPAEDAGGGAPVVVLSDGWWRRRFGGDPGVIGRTISIDERPATIIGVMPPTFDPPRFFWLGEQAFWRPYGVTEQQHGWGRFLLVVARLRDGVSPDAARDELVAIAAERAREDAANAGWSASLVPLVEQITGEVRTPLLVLLGAVGLLLVMAVANVASLTLAFTRRRERELAVRRAIGAAGGRLVRQLLVQHALLGAIGAIVGLGAAVLGVRLLVALLPPDIPRTGSIAVDGTVVAFTLGVTLIATVASGVVAARHATRRDLSVTLREGGRSSSSRLRGGALVTAEVALGLVLAVLAGLMVRSFVALRAVEPGFDATQVVAARVALVGSRYADPAATQAFYDALLERLRSTPGVDGASEVSIRPFGGTGPATSIEDPLRPAPPGTVAPIADVRSADGALFRTLRVPLLEGRSFDARERPDGPPGIVVNESLARALWPGERVVGRRVRLRGWRYDGKHDHVGEIVGVVRDMHLRDARTPPRPAIWLPSASHPGEQRDVIVRATGDAATIASVLRAAVAELDRDVPVYQLASLASVVNETLARDRFATLVLGAFAVIAVLLAGVGTYGVFNADVARRRRELGIRVALGAGSPGVMVLVLRRALARAVAGVAIGLAATLVAVRGMTSMLFGVGATDPVSLAAVSLLLLVVAVAATLVPAMRAARVSPLVAMSHDG